MPATENKSATLTHILELWKTAELELGRMEDGFHSQLGLIKSDAAVGAYKKARKALLREEQLTAPERDAILREDTPSPPEVDGNWKRWAKQMHAHLSAVKRNLEHAIQNTPEPKTGKAKVFFSWQDDDPKQRRLLLKCLKQAAEKCGAEFDHDTDRCTGSVPIVETILEKISESHVVVADVTPYNEAGDERLPNPNVMMEVGYAAHALGNNWDRIILLTNVDVGKPEELPFNIRHLRISTFRSNEKEADLIGKLASYIRMALDGVGPADEATETPVATVEDLLGKKLAEFKNEVEEFKGGPFFTLACVPSGAIRTKWQKDPEELTRWLGTLAWAEWSNAGDTSLTENWAETRAYSRQGGKTICTSVARAWTTGELVVGSNCVFKMMADFRPGEKTLPWMAWEDQTIFCLNQIGERYAQVAAGDPLYIQLEVTNAVGYVLPVDGRRPIAGEIRKDERSQVHKITRAGKGMEREYAPIIRSFWLWPGQARSPRHKELLGE